MSKSNAFSRFNRIVAIAATIQDPYLKQAYLGKYYSRGKGKGLTQKAPVHKAAAIKRAATKQRNIAKRK